MKNVRLMTLLLISVVVLPMDSALSGTPYRKIYGPGPWDWDVTANLGEPGLVDPDGFNVGQFNLGRPYPDPRVDLGRPNPKLTVQPPGQRYLDLIPDEPTVINSPK